MKPDSNRLFALDAAVILLVSALICLAGRRLSFMSVAVPLILLARFLPLAFWLKQEKLSFRAELIFSLVCLALGAFNDWNSVCNHKIYDYTVPSDLAWSTIPTWMLLYWGMILRFFARLSRWQALGPPAAPNNRLRLGRFTLDNPWAKVALELALVIATRQSIYRLYLDPIWSWAPFAAAILLYALIFRLDRHDLRLLALFAVGGPGIEILYINLGRLHCYHLGWLAGVPLWIALWWLLIILIWKDLTLRLETLLHAGLK